MNEMQQVIALLFWLYDANDMTCDNPFVPDDMDKLELNQMRLVIAERVHGESLPLPNDYSDFPTDPEHIPAYLEELGILGFANLSQALHDAYNYGMDGGVHGFIYHSDCREFLQNAWIEDEISDWLKDSEMLAYLAESDPNFLCEAIEIAINPDNYNHYGAWSGYSTLAHAFASYQLSSFDEWYYRLKHKVGAGGDGE